MLVGGDEIARGNGALEHAKAATGLRQVLLDARGGGTARRRAKSGVVGDRLACCKLPRSRPWASRSSTRVRVVSQQSMRYTQMRRLFLRGEVSVPGVARGEKLRTPPWRRDLHGDTRGRISSRGEQDAAVLKRLELVLNPESEPNSHFTCCLPLMVGGAGVMRLKRHHLA